MGTGAMRLPEIFIGPREESSTAPSSLPFGADDVAPPQFVPTYVIVATPIDATSSFRLPVGLRSICKNPFTAQKTPSRRGPACPKSKGCT
jgi:hypothetical protein